MKILIVSSRMPYPVNTGDKVLLYNRLKRLHKNHEITLVVLYAKDREITYIDNISSYCKKIYTFKISRIRSIFNVLLNFVFDKSPLQVLYFKINPIQSKIKYIYENEDFDLVNPYLIRTIPLIEFANTPIFLDMIDSMQLNYIRRIEKSKSFFLKFLYEFEYKRIVQYENNLPNIITKGFVVAEGDQTHKNIKVIPLGVDTSIFRPSFTKNNKTIIFSGNMSYQPNQQAILWFYKNCFPKVINKIPEAKLVVAGTQPSRDILKMQSDNILITGYVDSLSELISSSTISIAPMQSGSGMQNKILEAMSCAIPVVTTNIGLGSIKANHLEEIIVEDNPIIFADYVLDIISNPSKYKIMGKKAREYVKKEHSWESNLIQFESELNTL